MIKVEKENFENYEVNLLCEYSELRCNTEFSEIAKNAKSHNLNNKVIEESILKKLNDLNLVNDERFLNAGYYYMKDKNLLNLTLIQFNNIVYIDDYEVIFKVTDAKYSGEDADTFRNRLTSYERFDEEEVDFRIDRICDMGYYKSLQDKKFSFTLINGQPLVLYEDKTISASNTIVKAVCDFMLSKIEALLPNYILFKGKRLYFSQYSGDVYSYLENCFQSNQLFSLAIENVSIVNEHIYMDNEKIAEDFIADYLKKLLKTTILTTKEMDNILRELLLLEEFDDVRLRINLDRIKKSLSITVKSDAAARKNLDFANDILEDNQKYLGKVIDLNNREGILREILINTFRLSKEVKDIYLVSKYLVSYSFEKDFNELNTGEQKKKMVFDELLRICDDYDINLHMNIDQKNKTYSSVDLKKIDFKTIHGRYLVVKSKEINAYKLDGELDHFERRDHNVVFKDLQVTRYSDISNINRVVLESVGV